MFCVLKGKVCVMVYDEAKDKYLYIPFRRWERMPQKKRNQFRCEF